MNILLTSVGRRGYLVRYFKNELALTDKIICTNSSSLATAMQEGDKAYVSPLIYDKAYIPFLLDICRRENIDILLSLFDIDLAILSRHKKEFEKIGVKVIISDEKLIDICNDKFKMYEFLREAGFDTLYTSLNIEDKYIKDSLEEDKKFILKPRWGMGSIGIYKTEDFLEARVLYKRIKKEIQNSYLKYESKNDFENCILIQEFISGEEFGLDIINDLEGNYIKTVVKEKIAMRGGETDIAKIVKNDILEEIGRKISMKTRHILNMDLDLIVNSKGIFIIDMNARFGGGYPFTHMAGVNVIKLLLDLVNKKEIDKNKLIPKYDEIYAKDINLLKIKREND